MKEYRPENQHSYESALLRNQQGGSDVRLAYPLRSDWISRELNESPASQDVLEYWRILWLNKFSIIRFAILGLLLAFSFSFFQKRVYRARTSIAIQDLNENFLNMKEDPTAINAGPPNESYFQTQVQILQSDSLLERVIDKPAIAHALAQENTPGRRLDWRPYFGLSEPASTSSPKPTVESIAPRLTVRASPDTHIVQVYFESSDPKLAAELANTVVNEFVDQSHQMRWESTQRTAEWLAAHLNEMKANLENGEAQLQSYARASGLLFSDKGNVTEDKLRQIQEEYSKAQVDRAEKQAKYETAVSKPLESVPEALDDPTVRDLGIKLAALQQERAQLISTLTPEHYKVRQIQAQIDELSSALETQRKNIVRRAGNEYQSARRREELLAKDYGQQSKIFSDQSEKAIHYDTLKHEVEASRQLYDAMVQRVKQAGLAAAMRGSNILVVDKAKAPLLPYRPNYPLNSAVGLAMGAFFGIGFCILRARLNGRIEAPGIAPSHLNLPELGAIPVIPVITIPASQSSEFSSEQNPLGAIPGSAHNGSGKKLLKMTIADAGQDSAELFMVAEAFRATITSLLLPGLEGSTRPGIIVVASPGPGAGKTTVTCNLGIALAQVGRRVLLVDADLRRPTLHEALRVPNTWGLCDVLCSNHPINQIGATGLAHHTDVQGLDILPSGTVPKSPSHLLFSGRVIELFARLRQEYDLVLVDTPPMMLLADARVLGRIADGAVLVIRAGQTSLAQAQLAVQRFAEDGTSVLGTVLNGWNPKTAGTEYGQSYQQCRKEYLSGV